MPVNLSVKQVPDALVAALRERASRHHRSLQGELVAILQEAVAPRRLSIAALRDANRRRGLTTGDDATAHVRAERDAR